MDNKKDFLNGDHSFKNWFKIMWKNNYVLLFLIGFVGMVTQVVMFDDVVATVRDNFSYGTAGGVMTLFGMLLPTAITGIVAYKGFYQHWTDLKNRKSR